MKIGDKFRFKDRPHDGEAEVTAIDEAPLGTPRPGMLCYKQENGLNPPITGCVSIAKVTPVLSPWRLRA